MDHDPIPSLKLTGESVSRTFHLRSESGYGWALATLNDVTGELSIQSDWGDWAYRWNLDGLGERTLTEFVGSVADEYYLADKLCPDGRHGKADLQATRDDVRRKILESRRSGRMNLSRDDARSLWNFTASNEFRYEFEDGIDPEWDILERLLEGDRHYVLVWGPTWSYLVLRDAILPVVKRACRGES